MRGDLLRSRFHRLLGSWWCGAGCWRRSSRDRKTPRKTASLPRGYRRTCRRRVGVRDRMRGDRRRNRPTGNVARCAVRWTVRRPAPAPEGVLAAIAGTAPRGGGRAGSAVGRMVFTTPSDRPPTMDALCRTGGRVADVPALDRQGPGALRPGASRVWLVLADRSGTSGERAARGILAFAAILMALQAYPMPDGTQIVIGTVLFVPVALVAIAGAERSLGGKPPLDCAAFLGRRAILATLAVAVAANIGMKAQRLYARGIPLAMPGARPCARQSAMRRHTGG